MIAVIQFKGYAREEIVRNVTTQLLSILEKIRIETVGEPFLMWYNAPTTLGFLRRNEVGIEVRGRVGDTPS